VRRFFPQSFIHPIFAVQNLPMKTFFLVFLAAVILVSQDSCLKSSSSSSCTPASVASEEPTILAYAANNGILGNHHSSGLYYEIISTGSGPTPTLNSTIFVTYTGKLLDGSIFDQQADSSKTGWVLGSLIPGWQIGLPLIQKGGEIKLIIPSSLGYGCDDSRLPANSILYFDIHLLDVK
jgi:FKBP-type peptidyl-prolyl cis-trans isomerase FkpA